MVIDLTVARREEGEILNGKLIGLRIICDGRLFYPVGNTLLNERMKATSLVVAESNP